MSSQDRPQKKGARGRKVVECRRTGQSYALDEHERCPYCFGERADVATGEHAKFCDFEPGVDPVHFGFPEHNPRWTKA